MMRTLIISLIFFLASTANAFDLSVSVTGGSGSWSGGKYSVAIGQELTFTSTPTGGTAPYVYCWDFGTPPSGAKLGEWSTAGDQLCYSTDQNPTHTFNSYGIFYVSLYVTDAAAASAKATLIISIGVDGTVIDPTADCGANNLVGDGATDNAAKLGACITAQTGDVVIQFPAGTYRFVSYNSIEGATVGDVELRPASGASVTLQYDPVNAGGDVIVAFISWSNAKNIYVHDLSFVRDLDGGTVMQKDGTKALVILSTGSGVDTIQDCTFTNFSIVVDGIEKTLINRNNFVNWGARNGDDDAESNCFDQGGSVYYCSQSLLSGMLSNNMDRLSYSSPNSWGNSHYYYFGDNKSYFYQIGSYADFSNENRDIGSQNTPPTGFYSYLNTVLCNQAVGQSTWIDGTPITRELKDNIFQYCALGVKVDESATSVVFDSNTYMDVGTNANMLKIIYATAALSITNNIFGANVPQGGGYNNYSFDRQIINTDWCGACTSDSSYGAWNTDLPNPDCPCGTYTGNVDDTTSVDTSDPVPGSSPPLP